MVPATGGINSQANTADLSPLHSSFKEFCPLSPSLASKYSTVSSTIAAPSEPSQHGVEKLKCEPFRFSNLLYFVVVNSIEDNQLPKLPCKRN